MGVIWDSLVWIWDHLCGFMEYCYNNMDLVAFLILAAITIVAAIFVVHKKEVMHSAFYLALVFFCVGLFYFFLEAEFLGVIQMLVYVGAITILFAFSVMLTRRYIVTKEDDSDE
jgi:NADH-quinone oxidoreductase subunit J